MSMFSAAAAEKAETIVKNAIAKAKQLYAYETNPFDALDFVYDYCEEHHLFSE